MISARDQPVEQGVLKGSVIETCRTLTEGGPDAGRRLQDVLEEMWGYPAGRAAIRRMVPDGMFLEEDRADFLGSRIKPVRVATDGPWVLIPKRLRGLAGAARRAHETSRGGRHRGTKGPVLTGARTIGGTRAAGEAERGTRRPRSRGRTTSGTRDEWSVE